MRNYVSTLNYQCKDKLLFFPFKFFRLFFRNLPHKCMKIKFQRQNAKDKMLKKCYLFCMAQQFHVFLL